MLFIRRAGTIAYLLAAGIFIFDVVFPLENSNIPFTYLLPLILGVFFKEKNDVLLLGIITTVMTVVAVFLKPPTDLIETLLFNRTVSLLGIWAAVFLVTKILIMREDENAQDEQFQALFQYASNGILIVNKRGEIVKANSAAAKLFGFERLDLHGQNIEILIPGRFKRVHERHRTDYQAQPKPRSMGTGLNLFAQRKDGTEFPVEISLSPFKTTKGEFVVAFIIDNTIRNENEQRIIRQNQRLEQLAAALQNLNENLEIRITERTRALEQARNELSVALSKERDLGELKSRFVSMASHEFRTPLSTMQSSAALIASYADRGDIPNIKKHALRIKNSVNSLNTILTEFLSLGKLEEGQTQANVRRMDLVECVDEVATELKPLLKTGQVFKHRHEGQRETFLDPGLIRHTLLNLVTNAIKYSPENKPILVETSVLHDQVHIRVIDEGMGIPEADQKHLFTRFFRATNAGHIQGTGLGLYIVKCYVDLMKGKIGYESREGKGTTIWLEFPVGGK